MDSSVKTEFANKCFEDGPQSVLERALLEEYLQSKGYNLMALHSLPEKEAKTLMTEACQYASLKLAQVESAVHFRETIRDPS